MTRTILAAALTMVAANPVLACSFTKSTRASTEARVDFDLVKADVIAEVEVVRHPGRTDGSAVARPIKIWRGKDEPYYDLFVATSCSAGFSDSQVGERRIIAMYKNSDGTYGSGLTANYKQYQKIIRWRLARVQPRVVHQ